MTDPHERKYQEMQKYVPFIQRVIEKLKVNNDFQSDNPRKAQLQKMEMLHDLLTNKHKKIKIETLIKCEGVLIKLQAKIEKNEDLILSDIKLKQPCMSTSKNISAQETEDILGPASPPPEVILVDDVDQPIVIPTERRSSPILVKETGSSADKSQKHKKESPDQYRIQNLHHSSSGDFHSVRKKVFNFDCKDDKTKPSKDVHNSRSSNLQEQHHAKESQHSKHSSSNRQSNLLPKEKNDANKSTAPGQKLQNVKVVITEPLPAHFKMQHFPPSSKYLARSSVCHNNLRTLPQASQTKLDHNDVYSPEELWDKYNESHNKHPTVRTPVFSRLGTKVPETSSASSSTSKTSGRYTPIPDVLKSPPLSVSDINNLLLESGSDKIMNDISEIGSRRPAKTEDNQKESSNNSFEFVRKKLAQTAKMNSPRSETSKISTDIEARSISQERIALKYNPHPRQERLPSVSSTDGSECSIQSKICDPRIKLKLQTGSLLHSPTQVVASNVNVLPSINLSDPRLKKQNALSTSPERKSLPSTPPSFTSTPNMGYSNHNPISYGGRKDPRISRIPNNTIPSMQTTPARRMSTSQPQYSPEENWDTDEEEKTLPPIKTDTGMSKKDQHKVESICERSIEARGCTTFERNHSYGRNITPNERDNLNQPKFQLDSAADKVPLICTEKKTSIAKSCSSPNVHTKQNQHKTQSSIKHNILEDTPKPKNKLIPSSTFVIPNPPKSDTEDDWDSEPEVVDIKKIPLKPDVIPRLPINKSPVAPVTASYHTQTIPFVAPKHTTTAPLPSIPVTQIPHVQSQYPIGGSSIHHINRMQKPIPNNRFSSLLNDKSERIKYFEAKKQKNIEPRTYKEFREAKERAQAQEAAIKRAADEAEFKKRADELKEANKGKETMEKTNDKKEKQFDTSKKLANDKRDKKSHHKDSKKSSAGESTLDKMYRTQNFNTNFPKANTSFKIPKKKTEETEKPREETATKTNETPTEVARNVPSDKLEVKIKPNQTEAPTVETKLVNHEHNDKESNHKSNHNNMKTKLTEPFAVRQVETNISNKSEEKQTGPTAPPPLPTPPAIKDSSTTPKPANDKSGDNSDKKSLSGDISSSKQNEKDINEEPKEAKEKSQEQLFENNLNKSAVDDNNKLNVRDPRCRLKSSTLVKSEDIKEKEIDESKFKMLGDIMITSSENEVILKPQQNLDKFNKLTQELTPKPQRILRRRNTMVVFDSAPLVDKDKLKKANALLFEDVQEEEKRKRKQAEEDRIVARRNKHLEDMFKKTDDNCTVSTQNIITGKRRTRPTINFNETANAINIFKHKTVKDSPLGDSTTTPIVTQQPVKTSRSNFKIKIKNLGFPNTKDDENGSEDEVKIKIKDIKGVKAKSSKDNKLKDDEQQNCVVSSTSADNCTVKESTCTSTSTNRTFKKETDDNEPTSTASKSNNPSTTGELNVPVLEEIVDQILTPNENREHILDVLGQVLSEDKLELIKSLIESSNKHNEDHQIIKEDKQSTAEENSAKIKTVSKNSVSNIKEDVNEDEDEPEDRKPLKLPKATGGKKMLLPKKKRSELDRLNEDIRDMFICNGVITATGRRMCTIMGKDVASVSSKKSSTTVELENTNKRKEETLKPPVSKRTLRRSIRCSKAIDDNEDTESNISRTTEESIDDFNGSADNSTAMYAIPLRKMPVLKPHTPIKMPEDVASKPPNSKDTGGKRKSDSKPTGLKAKKSKINTENSESEEKESEAEVDAAEEEEEEERTENPKKDIIIKNTNIHWHNQSKYTTWCMICEKRIPSNASSLHYKTHHRENYISRMAPVLLQQFKQGKLNQPLFGIKKAQKQNSWFYRCPFCLKYFNTPMSLWLEHFQNHTVEYRYECSQCHRSSNRKLTVSRHIKSCEGATIITSAVKLNVPTVINAHICHLCNFIQLKRVNLERHYIEQHHLEKKTVELLGYTIKLFDVENVECVNEKNAVEREKEAWKCIEKDEQVIDIDDDETPCAVPNDNNSNSLKENATTCKEKSIEEKNRKEHNSIIDRPETKATADKINESVIKTNTLATNEVAEVSNLADGPSQDEKIIKPASTEKDKIKPLAMIAKHADREDQTAQVRVDLNKRTNLISEKESRKEMTKKATSEQEENKNRNKNFVVEIKQKKYKNKSILDLVKTQSNDFEVIDAEVTAQNIQDELLILAAKAAEGEDETENLTQIDKNNVEPQPLLSGYKESRKEVNLSNYDTPKVIINNHPASKPETTMSDIISSSIDMIYNRDGVSTDLQTSLDTENACPTASNVFMPTRDVNNYSPTIQILAQSIINIDEDASDSVKDKPITMAERLSQRFKELQSDTTTCGKSNIISSTSSSTNKSSTGSSFEKLINDTLLELTKEKDSAINKSINQTPAEASVVTEQPKENVFEKLFSETVLELEKDNENENVMQILPQKDLTQPVTITVISDDEDWEDIEITETAPTATTTNAGNTQKSKNKGLYQKFGIFKGNNTKSKKHLTPMVFLPKKKTKEKPLQATTLLHSPTTTATAATTNTNEVSITNNTTITTTTTTTSNNSLSNSNAHLGFKPVVSIMDGLFPDSPCNDPIDLVPELAPLEPLQDLNDISSILDSNLSAVNINAADNHTSIEDALDFISEQQANDKQKSNGLGFSIIPSQSKTTTNNISHVGFSLQSGEENHFKFYCLLQNCSFLYSSDSVGLETHFMCEHSQIKWNGYCLMCQSQCFPNNGDDSEKYPISKEIRHMMEKHANKAPALDLNTDSTQHSTTSSHDSEERPKIKLRRLTGDCLSRATPENVTSGNEAVNTTTCASPHLSMLGALLVADPKPPTKEMPPQPQMDLTEPILVDNNTKNSPQMAFKNVDSDFLITSVKSAGATANQKPLQISNVVSLNTKATPPPTTTESELIQIPKISDVRTLAPKAGNLWTQQTEKERIEFLEAAEESLEVSRILRNAGNPSTNREQSRSGNDSPVLVAETVPLAQSTTGDFVVTQTVSAQYDEFSSTAVGFNISIAASTNTETLPTSSTSVASRQYKCKGNGCKFVSRVPVAMSDHLRFHERRNFSNKQDYLICSFCYYCASDVEDYMKHANQFHIINKGSAAPQVTTPTEIDTATSLTKKIQNILSTSSNGSCGQIRYSAKNQTTQVQDTQEVYLKKLRETIDEIVGPTGLADDKLYRCVIKNCLSQLSENTFLSHIMFHITTTGGNPNNYIFKCPHCTAQYHRPAGIKAHIKNHARNRYFCYLCDETSTNPGQLLKHFSEKHWHTLNMCTKELLEAKVSSDGTDSIIDSSYYVAYTQDLSAEEVRKFGEKLILEWQRKKSGSKTHFKSTEIDLLPLSAIFQRQVNCGECEYKTKVRTNMFRHLLMHKQNPGMVNKSGVSKVCSVDPVNPVPCLNTSERFFDKMTNLASSSLIPPGGGPSTTQSSFKLPQAFVEESKRYTCGCQGCNYHTISEDLFRTHLSTIHSTALTYCCTFCKEEICKRGLTLDRIMNHTRFHGTTIYRCEDCNYFHHMRYVVERHINEKHATMKVNIVTHNRSSEDNVEGTTTTVTYAGKKYKETDDINQTPQTSNASTRSTSCDSSGQKPIVTYVNSAKGKGKWLCDVCGHRTTTVGQMQAHCQQQHAVKNQYKCAHCIFGSQQLSQILHHIDEKHSGKTREARYMYHKIANHGEEVTDTRPLWQRNDPTRIRHIRGILMEDEEESEEYRKRLALTEEVDDEGNEALRIDIEEIDRTYILGYEFGCYHCSFKAQSFEDLKNKHYAQAHNSKLETAKPFWYRLQRRLCCPECRSFLGYYGDLQQHLQKTHKKRFYAADMSMAENDDTSQRILCGYCTIHCASAEDLYKHHVKAQHWPQDIRIDNNEQIMEILALGKAEVSYQCTLCADIFSNRVAIVQHACNFHSGEDNFSFRELTNSLIYRCNSCCFTSTTESELMRHTIDHYSRFKVCSFCLEPQSSFNAYMQHCYAEHKNSVQKFRTIYPLTSIQKFLLQTLVIFPSGLVLNKRSLRNTKYGNTGVIEEIYEDIYKISQQPPIPRLSIARLVARKSIEAQQKHVDYSPTLQDDILDAMQPRSKSISKRRRTVAFSLEDHPNTTNTDSFLKPKITIFEGKTPAALVKRRTTVDNDQQQQLQTHNDLNDPVKHNIISKRRRTVAVDRDTLFSSNLMSSSTNSLLTEIDDAGTKRKCSYTHAHTPSPKHVKEVYPLNLDMEPFSFYGQTPEALDLSKIYTKVAIGGTKTPLTVEKFKILFDIDCHLKLTKCDEDSQLLAYADYKHIKKACPASEKFRHN